MPKIKLYSYLTSPYVSKVHCYLLYKELPFEVVYVNPTRVKHELPVGQQVPVLSVDDELVVDSRVISNYLDERFNNHRPMVIEGYEAAIVEFEDWIDQQFIPVLFQMIRPTLMAPRKVLNAWRLAYCVSNTCRGGLPLSIRAMWPVLLNRVHFIRMPALRMRQQGGAEVNRKKLLQRLETILEQQDYLVVPDQISMPDISLFPLLVVPYSLKLRFAEDIDSYPNIRQWLLRLSPFFSLDKQPALVPKHLVFRNRYLSQG